MKALLEAVFSRNRTVMLLLSLLLIAGGWSYYSMPKEAAPSIDIPIFFVTVIYQGISPEDSERLMIRPLERELQAIEGLDEMRSWAGEGFALIRLDFYPGYSNDRALSDLREEVDLAKAELPDGAEEPQVFEVDLSLIPVLTVHLSGPLPERKLVEMARFLRDRIESLPGVLEVDIGGDREDLMEIIIDPLILETYHLSYDAVATSIGRNNYLAPAGAIDTGNGRLSLRIPGTVENIRDVENTAVIVNNGTVVTVGDIAEVRQTFKDPLSIARINGQPSVALEIRKRDGANIIDTVYAARAIIEAERANWPEALRISYMQDLAESISDLLGDLQNNVLSAMLLVLLAMLGALSIRAGLLVALAIPGSFLTGILAVNAMGYTLNIVVLFALILVVGMLVDGAIIVVELADRYLAQGMERRDAFLRASQRMSWPIISSTATTLAVFFPMLFWPGMVGRFLIFLPTTVIVTLLASLMMALVFIPVLGTLVGPRRVANPGAVEQVMAAEEGRFASLKGVTAIYIRWLARACRHPLHTLLIAIIATIASYMIYGAFGRGLEFFPDVEPDFLQLQIQARGNLSIWESDQLVRSVESRLGQIDAIKTVYARTIGGQQARIERDYAEDVVGIIQLELIDWRQRPPAEAIIGRIRSRIADIPGIQLQLRKQDVGLGQEKPIIVQISSRQRAHLLPSLKLVRERMSKMGGFVDVEDDRPVPGVELELIVDRKEMARYGADVMTLAQTVLVLSDGSLVGTYRPDFTDEEVDMRMRYDLNQRDLGQLARLRLTTTHGLVPISNFITINPVPAVGVLKRVDGNPAYTVKADAAQGFLVDDQMARFNDNIPEFDLPEGVEISLKGEFKDQVEAGNFLVLAFFLGLFFMVLILVTQLNSFLQALLVLSAIIFSTAGVLLGLLIRGEPFGLVMSGIGILALAGIVVNNNIVLIDTYNAMRLKGIEPIDAALRTGAQRMRPVFLTALTTVIGLLTMVFSVTIDIIGRDFYIGAPVTQYWVQLATAIAGGLFITTPITLLFTPAMLVWLDKNKQQDSTSNLAVE